MADIELETQFPHKVAVDVHFKYNKNNTKKAKYLWSNKLKIRRMLTDRHKALHLFDSPIFFFSSCAASSVGIHWKVNMTEETINYTTNTSTEIDFLGNFFYFAICHVGRCLYSGPHRRESERLDIHLHFAPKVKPLSFVALSIGIKWLLMLFLKVFWVVKRDFCLENNLLEGL